MVDEKGVSIGVNGVMLNPKDIRHDYNIKASFGTFDPIIQMENRRLGLAEMNSGAISPKTYREIHMQIEDEAKEADRILEHQFDQLPDIKSIALRNKARSEGMDEEYDELLKQSGGDVGLIAKLSGEGGTPVPQPPATIPNPPTPNAGDVI